MQPVVSGTPAPPAVFSSGFLQLPELEPFGQNGWWVLHFSRNDPTCSPMGTTVLGLSDSSGLPEQCWALHVDISGALCKGRQEPLSCNSTDGEYQAGSACPRAGSRLGGGGNRLLEEGSLLCFSSCIYINGLHFLQVCQSWLQVVAQVTHICLRVSGWSLSFHRNINNSHSS